MSVNIDQAWDKLHARLADEQLLVQEDAPTTAMPFMTKVRWAAAIAILCICGGAAGWLLFPVKGSAPLFTLYNNEESNTLVSTLNDGSIVYLNCGATLTCPDQFAVDKREVSLQGEALFDIQSNQSSPFLIETEPVVVEVLGTAFNIRSNDKESFELSVQRGLVKVTLKSTGAPELVEAGQTVRLQANRQLQKEQSTDRLQFAHYTEKMRFKDERLDNIIKVINKISDKPVVFDSSLAGREVAITFVNNTPSDMVDLLCLALDLKRSDNGDSIVIEGR